MNQNHPMNTWGFAQFSIRGSQLRITENAEVEAHLTHAQLDADFPVGVDHDAVLAVQVIGALVYRHLFRFDSGALAVALDL